MKPYRVTPLCIQFLVLVFAVMTGCSSMPDTLQGNDLSHLSLRDKRLADKNIQVIPREPSSSQNLGKVSTKRCQSSMFSETPVQTTLLLDIKAQAYRLGANAISHVTYEQYGAVADGCWSVFSATANMLVID